MVMPKLPAQRPPDDPTWTQGLGFQPRRLMEQVED